MNDHNSRRGCGRIAKLFGIVSILGFIALLLWF
jgi:hypothetical protein